MPVRRQGCCHGDRCLCPTSPLSAGESEPKISPARWACRAAFGRARPRVVSATSISLLALWAEPCARERARGSARRDSRRGGLDVLHPASCFTRVNGEPIVTRGERRAAPGRIDPIVREAGIDRVSVPRLLPVDLLSAAAALGTSRTNCLLTTTRRSPRRPSPSPHRQDFVSVGEFPASRSLSRSPAAHRCGRCSGAGALSNAGAASRGWAANHAA